MKETSASLCRRAVKTLAEPIGVQSIPPLRLALLLYALCGVPSAVLGAQGLPDPGDQPGSTVGSAWEEDSPAPAKVDVLPVARDEDIRQRLQRVLEATGWFSDPRVRVEEGVVFLTGQTDTDRLKKWAGDLARNTQDVVAVVNQTEVILPSVWDFRPAWAGVQVLWRDLIRSLPFVVFGLFVLVLSAGAGMLAARGALRVVRRRIQAKLLRNVIARAAGMLVFLIGFYVVLRVSGLTQLALTVIGGTGLIGLVVGIAFRDITENFLSSIFLSMQRPFERGDLVEIAGATGYVQQLNVRTTVLMTLDGNIVQIPNATVYKSNLRNFTTNANRRENFVIGIGYDDSITAAQEIARAVLANHPAVLNDPEPSVLVEDLGTSTVNLRVFFWLNGREHSWLKVRSSVIRLLKVAFQQNGISMPDEAREMVFPKGVPVVMLNDASARRQDAPAQMRRPASAAQPAGDPVSTEAEAGLYSEAGVIEEQARQARAVKEGENLLPGVAESATTAKPAQAPSAPRDGDRQ
jgi:small-conductance mechanosensitive channel